MLPSEHAAAIAPASAAMASAAATARILRSKEGASTPDKSTLPLRRRAADLHADALRRSVGVLERLLEARSVALGQRGIRGVVGQAIAELDLVVVLLLQDA